MATIVSNLLSFARQQDEESEKIYLNNVIFDAIDLIRYQLSKNCILLEVELPEELPSGIRQSPSAAAGVSQSVQ